MTPKGGLLSWFVGPGIWVASSFVLLVAAVMGLLMRRMYSTGARRFQEGRVTGIVGRKGNGKTLFLTHEQLRHIGRQHYCKKCSKPQPILPDGYESIAGFEAEHGREALEALPKRPGVHTYHVGHVASNGVLKLPAHLAAFFIHVKSWEDLLDLPHCTLVVLDEVHVDGWAPARQGEQLPPYVQWLLAQCRKLVLEILWCAQREDRVSLGLQRQTDEIGMCVKGLWKRMIVRFYEPEDVNKARMSVRSSNGPVVKANWTYRYKVSKRVASAYDTYELLRPGENAGDIDVAAAQDRIASVMKGAPASGRSPDRAPLARQVPSAPSPVRIVRTRENQSQSA